MKNYKLIALGLLALSPLSAENLRKDQNQIFFTSSELKKIKEKTARGEDVIILKDGTQIGGEIPVLPEIVGEMSLGLREIVAIEMLPDNSQMQLTTNEGASVICDLPSARIKIVQYFPSIKNPTHTLMQEIEPQTIKYIMFKETTRPLDKIQVVDLPQNEDLLLQKDLFANLELELTRTQVLQNSLQELKSKWDGMKDHMLSLQNKNKGLKLENFKEKNKFYDFEMAARELQGIKRSVDGQRELSAQFEAHIVNLNNRIAEEQLLHGQTKSALEDHLEKVNINEDQVVGLKGEIEKYKNSLHQANQNLEEAKRTFSGENQKVNRLSKAAEDFKKIAEHYKSQLDTLKLSLIAKDEELQSLQQSQDILYGSLNKEVSRLFTEKQGLAARQEELEDIIDTLLTALDDEKERSEQMAMQFRKMDQNASAIEREYFLFQDDIHSKLESMDKFNTSQQELNLSLIDQINQLISQNQQILNEKEALQKSLIQIEKQRSQTMETLARRDLEIEQLTASRKPFKRNFGQIYEPERSRIHVVVEGDSLNQISMRYYGVPHRWADIYEANDDIISDVNQLIVGNVLIIPE